MIERDRITKLCVRFGISQYDARNIAPGLLEEYIRKKIANELVKQILEEDLILINVTHNGPLDSDAMEVRADLKIIQE